MKWNRETIQSATSLLGCIAQKFSFVISLLVAFNTLCYIKGLTVFLQLESLDIVQGIQMVAEVNLKNY